MRNMSQAFYTPTEDEFKALWDNALIVLDTNSLLNLYRYSENTYQAYFQLLTIYKDRLWMPYTVGMEFHKNRYNSKHSQHQFYSDIIAVLNSFIEPFEKVLGNCRYHRFIEPDTLLKGFKRRVDSQIKAVEATKEKHKNVLDTDGILTEITNLYEDKVGSPLSEDAYKKTCENGKKRYELKIPPGYKDKDPKKGNSQYGDYLIWEAMIDKALESEQDIIFVTDDGKEDWWLKPHGKTIGPRPELLEEFKKRSNQLIYFYKPDRFLEYASEIQDQPVDESVTEEVLQVSDRSRTRDIAHLQDLSPRDIGTMLSNRSKKFPDTSRHQLSLFRPLRGWNKTERNLFSTHLSALEEAERYNKFLQTDQQNDLLEAMKQQHEQYETMKQQVERYEAMKQQIETEINSSLSYDEDLILRETFLNDIFDDEN